MPDLTREFMTKIPRFQDKKAFIFTTMLSFSGDGALVALRGLRKKGYDVKQAINIAMPNNVILPYIFFRNFPHHTKEQKIEIREQASAMIAKLADKIITEQNWQQGRDPISVVGGLIQRVPMRFIGWSRFAKNFFVNKETCIECMQCVDYCPTENITYQDGKFSWGENCILCLRCYNFCPVEAIQFKKATLDKDKFPRYKGPVEDFHPQKMLK
ncbi:MAG: EFR1 family ferrodoxin, partial [Asgard group archaeon]|nr:EFR1 family ferrodoxin [Asgard group archaeon]